MHSVTANPVSYTHLDVYKRQAWRSDKTKPKFLLINLPFQTLTVKRLALKKKTVLGIYMEEKGLSLIHI